MSLKNRTALITGGSKGLGLATAVEMSQAGASVVLLARDESTLKEAQKKILTSAAGSSPQVEILPCDLTDSKSVEEALQVLSQKKISVDILVNNAGQAFAKPLMELKISDFHKDLELKLFAAIRCIQWCWPHMQKQKWGRIINVLHIGAKAPIANSAPSSISRAAGLALTKVLSLEGAPHNILVNSLMVGWIESDQWVRQSQSQNKTLDHLYLEMGQKIPLGRVGQAKEFAQLALFLASEAGSYITGSAINVDGGLSPVV